MPNIMMTDICNLNCPYCFANEFVHRDANEITEAAFRSALDFLLGDGSNHTVGLIGGEPTTHSKFDELLRIALIDQRVETVVVYTNGLLLHEHADLLCHEKVRLLVNCNSPDTIGEKRFAQLRDNLDMMVWNRLAGNHVTLGINLYETDFSYSYIIELLKRYHFDCVRTSLTVPNTDNERNLDAHAYFMAMKPRMLSFFRELLEADVVPYFDCNKIPSCLLDEGELEELRVAINNPRLHDRMMRSNISSSIVTCSPVIDILQDLTAVRCFGLSRSTRKPIGDFRGLSDLKSYYRLTVDACGYATSYSKRCVDCYERKTLRCSGGCLAFKERRIQSLCKHLDELANGDWRTYEE